MMVDLLAGLTDFGLELSKQSTSLVEWCSHDHLEFVHASPPIRSLAHCKNRFKQFFLGRRERLFLGISGQQILLDNLLDKFVGRCFQLL